MLEGIYLALTLVTAALAAGYLFCITDSILGQSKTLSIIDTILWALCTIVGFLTLKEAKEKQVNAQSADLEIIDLDCEEVQNDETKKEEP